MLDGWIEAEHQFAISSMSFLILSRTINKHININIALYINDGEGGFVLTWKDDVPL